MVSHGFTCLGYKSLTFQAQGIRSIPRFQTDPSSTGLAFKLSDGNDGQTKHDKAIPDQTDSSNSTNKNVWWVSRWGQTFENSSKETQESFSGNALCTMIATVSQLLEDSISCLEEALFTKHTKGIRNPSLLFHERWQRCECYFGQSASSRLQDSLSHCKILKRLICLHISVKFASGFWLVKCEIVKQLDEL